MGAFGLPPEQETVLQLVLARASGAGEPVKKMEIDRLVRDESRPVLDRLVQLGWIREVNGPRFVPTLQAMLVEEGAFPLRQLLDATIDYAAALFRRGRDTFSVPDLFEALYSRRFFLLKEDEITSFNLQNALFGLEPFISVQDVPSVEVRPISPSSLRISPKIQTVTTLQEVLSHRQADVMAADEREALRALYERYVAVQDRRRAILGFENDRQHRTFRRLHDAGKVEQYGVGGYFFSAAGLDEARRLFGGESSPLTSTQQFSPSRTESAPLVQLLDRLATMGALTPEFAGLLERDAREVGICLQHGAHKAALILCGSILEGVLVGVLGQNGAVADREFKLLAGKQHKSFPEDATLPDLRALARNANLQPGLGPLLGEVHELLGKLVNGHRDLVHPHAEVREGQLPVDQRSARIVHESLCAVLEGIAGKVDAGWLDRYRSE